MDDHLVFFNLLTVSDEVVCGVTRAVDCIVEVTHISSELGDITTTGFVWLMLRDGLTHLLPL